MSQIQAIRNQLAALKAQVNAEFEAEFLKRSAHLSVALEETVYSMHNNGVSLNKIAKEYGTKNWQTVKDLYTAADKRHNPSAATIDANQHAETAPTTTVDIYAVNVQWVGEDTFAVSVPANWESTTGEPYTGTVAVKINRTLKAVTPYAGGGKYPLNTPLHRELADWRNRSESAVVALLTKEAKLNV